MTNLFEDWAQADEEWANTVLIGTLRKTMRSKRTGQLKWMTFSQLMEIYKDQALVEGLIERKEKEAHNVRNHPDFPLEKQLRLYKCFVAMEEAHEEEDEKVLQVQLDARVDQEGGKAMVKGGFAAFGSAGCSGGMLSDEEQEDAEPKKGGKKDRKREAKPKVQKELTKEQQARLDGNRKLRDLGKWSLEAASLGGAVLENQELKQMPEVQRSLADSCKQWHNKFKEFNQALFKLLEDNDMEGVDELLPDIQESRDKFLQSADTVKRTIPKAKKQPRKKDA